MGCKEVWGPEGKGGCRVENGVVRAETLSFS